MYRELKFRYILNEVDGAAPIPATPSNPTPPITETTGGDATTTSNNAIFSNVTISGWENPQNLKSKFSEQVLSLLNQMAETKKFDLWQEAQDKCETSDERTALSELFLIKAIGTNLQYLTQGKDIVISWVNQLGFKKMNNPYLEFIPIFFSTKANQIPLTRDGIITMNDMYANGLVDENDMKGKGEEGLQHIIFDGCKGGLYHSEYQEIQAAQAMLKVIEYYKFLSNSSTVAKLNLKAIVSYNEKENPYRIATGNKVKVRQGDKEVEIDQIGFKVKQKGSKAGYIEINEETGTMKDPGQWKLVRDAIMYKTITNANIVANVLQSFYWIDEAVKLGTQGTTSSQTQTSNRRTSSASSVINDINDGEFSEEDIKAIISAIQTKYNIQL